MTSSAPAILIGTGGLGTGVMLELHGNHTLGREESRMAGRLDVQDRCKLHIITYYVARLLHGHTRVVPVGAVGADAAGREVLAELVEAGYDTSFVTVDPARPTLHSICFTYPDGDGGNLTLADSASDAVDVPQVLAAEPLFADHAGRGFALAAPEVPLAARIALLETATRHGFTRFASFLSGEMEEALEPRVLCHVDVLAINIDEARTAANLPADTAIAAESVAMAAKDVLLSRNPDLRFVITAGPAGSWVWDGQYLSHQGALTVEAQNTAGAGDAHLAGLMIGIARGLDLRRANELATLLSAFSVTSNDTINLEADWSALAAFAADHGVSTDAWGGGALV